MSVLKKMLVVTLLLGLAGCQSLPWSSSVPEFDHIVLILLENQDMDDITESGSMPNFIRLLDENTALNQYYALEHPSLPNYLALIGGDTFGIDDDCIDCFVDAPNVVDLIEESGRTWKTYQEDMPSPCFVGDDGLYMQKHNPFIYFDSIRLDKERCERSVVPLSDMEQDIANGSLPNFIFITPNMCNNSHDCMLSQADAWLVNELDVLLPALERLGNRYMVAVLFDEGDNDEGRDDWYGGRVPFLLISPLARQGFSDNNYYTHYSLLKTISDAWGLPYVGHAAEVGTVSIRAPWK